MLYKSEPHPVPNPIILDQREVISHDDDPLIHTSETKSEQQ